MHWTNELWACEYCGVEVGQSHQAGCAMRQTCAEVIWFGPPVAMGMLPRLVVEGDVIASFLRCVYCDGAFNAGDVTFENRTQAIALHGGCVLQLAQMVPRELESPGWVESEFERRRAEILNDLP